METCGGFSFCRVCLVPEENVKFASIFDQNAKIALKIYEIARIVMIDVDERIPSLICEKCVVDFEAVEKLKMRILDADEYFTSLTLKSEKKFLEIDMKGLISEKTKTPLKTPQNKERLSQTQSSLKARKSVEIKIKPKPDMENIGLAVTPKLMSGKRKLDTYDDDNSNKKPSIPSSTPNKFGITRMVILSKKSKEKINNSAPSAPKTMSPITLPKKKRSFKPKLRLGGRSKVKKNKSKILFECDNCKDTFESCQELNDHLKEHDFVQAAFICAFCESTFATSSYLEIHMKARHEEEANDIVKEILALDV